MRSETSRECRRDSASEGPSQRIDLRVSSIEVVNDTEDAQAPADGGVRLTVRWPQEPQLRAPAFPLRRAHSRRRSPAAAGGLSRSRRLEPRGLSARPGNHFDGVGNHRARRAARASRKAHFLACRIAALQHATSARLLALPAAMRRLPAPLRLSEDDAMMLAAMTTGDRTYLTHSLRVGFERTGSFHMLVVSGFHLAIVAGCFFWIARRLRLPRVPATLITIAASFAYALFTGFATPVQRSLWMVTLYLLGRLVYRERSPLNTIGFAALCLLVVSPRSLFDSSLQMTLLAVVAIAGVAAPLLAEHDSSLSGRDARSAPDRYRRQAGAAYLAQFRVMLRMIASRLQRALSARIAWRVFPWAVRFALRCVELLVVSCVVELAMTLPMAIYFHRITVFALPVNIFILPLLLAC